MKLQQGQTWQQGSDYFRIVHLERLEVEYKLITDLVTRQGTHYHVSKKDFCRLIKNATLLPPMPKFGPPVEESPLEESTKIPPLVAPSQLPGDEGDTLKLPSAPST